jgi:hypothetical protein
VVNGVSRNPYVLPTFLRFIPKNDRIRPQFFPMVRPTRGRRHGIMVGLLTTFGASAAPLEVGGPS